jgi:threonine dehydrogenase-like Zn-dependent dehydrogenase
MGLLFVQGLRRTLAGCVCAFDIDSERLALASEFGAHDIVDSRGDVPDDLTGSFDIVIETAGKPRALDLALKLSKRGALIETFAWHHHDFSFNLDQWHLQGWRFLNVQPGMTPHFEDVYPRTITLMANRIFSNERLVTHYGAAEQAKEMFDAALDKTGGYIKGVVLFQRES